MFEDGPDQNCRISRRILSRVLGCWLYPKVDVGFGGLGLLLLLRCDLTSTDLQDCSDFGCMPGASFFDDYSWHTRVLERDGEPPRRVGNHASSAGALVDPEHRQPNTNSSTQPAIGKEGMDPYSRP